MNNILEMQHVCKSFGGVKAVNDISLSVKKGSIYSIIGPNGAGKTTVFNLITGIYPIDSGTILLNNDNITNQKQHVITNKGIARTFQNIRLFKGLNVLENVMTAYDPHNKYGLLTAMACLPKKQKLEKENRETSMKYLEMVGIADYAKENPNNLPYGIQRKVEIARALATNPQILLLDEPGAGLNSMEIEDLMTLIIAMNQKLDLSVMLIEHRMKVVMSLSEYIYVMHFGSMLDQGNPKHIQNSEAVQKAYIGIDEEKDK